MYGGNLGSSWLVGVLDFIAQGPELNRKRKERNELPDCSSHSKSGSHDAAQLPGRIGDQFEFHAPGVIPLTGSSAGEDDATNELDQRERIKAARGVRCCG